jgi:hypothetical protein
MEGQTLLPLKSGNFSRVKVVKFTRVAATSGILAAIPAAFE